MNVLLHAKVEVILPGNIANSEEDSGNLSMQRGKCHTLSVKRYQALEGE